MNLDEIPLPPAMNFNDIPLPSDEPSIVPAVTAKQLSAQLSAVIASTGKAPPGPPPGKPPLKKFKQYYENKIEENSLMMGARNAAMTADANSGSIDPVQSRMLSLANQPLPGQPMRPPIAREEPLPPGLFKFEFYVRLSSDVGNWIEAPGNFDIYKFCPFMSTMSQRFADKKVHCCVQKHLFASLWKFNFWSLGIKFAIRFYMRCVLHVLDFASIEIFQHSSN